MEVELRLEQLEIRVKVPSIKGANKQTRWPQTHLTSSDCPVRLVETARRVSSAGGNSIRACLESRITSVLHGAIAKVEWREIELDSELERLGVARLAR